MKALKFVRFGILLALVVFYLYMGSTSVEKYLAKKTLMLG